MSTATVGQTILIPAGALAGQQMRIERIHPAEHGSVRVDGTHLDTGFATTTYLDLES